MKLENIEQHKQKYSKQNRLKIFGKKMKKLKRKWHEENVKKQSEINLSKKTKNGK